MTRRKETMNLLWNLCCCFTNLISSIFKGCLEFLGKYKKEALAVLFLVLEAISTALDMIGKSRLSFVVAALLLSAFGFGMTIYTCLIERTRLHAQRQLTAVEIVFSVVQLIATFVHFIMAILGTNNNFNPSFFPLAFAIIAVVFVFRKDTKDINSRRLLRSNSPPQSSTNDSSSNPDEFEENQLTYEDLLNNYDPHADLEAYEDMLSSYDPYAHQEA